MDESILSWIVSFILSAIIILVGIVVFYEFHETEYRKYMKHCLYNNAGRPVDEAIKRCQAELDAVFGKFDD